MAASSCCECVNSWAGGNKAVSCCCMEEEEEIRDESVKLPWKAKGKPEKKRGERMEGTDEEK